MKLHPIVPSLLLPLCLAGCVGEVQPFASGAAAVEAISDSEVVPASAPKAAAPASNRFEAQAGRRMTYAVTLAMSVDDLAAAQRKIEAMVKESGGYVQESNDSGGVLRIPLKRADEILRQIEACGSVDSRRIVGTDVTAAVVDVEIRLENLRKMRVRLLALLEKSEKVEDTLKVEQELNRVVTDIERYEAQLAGLNNRIDYVTLTLRLNQSAPVRFVPQLPVPWVSEVGNQGDGLPEPNGSMKMPFGMALPDDFAILASFCDGGFRRLYAVTADDCVLRLTRRPSLEGATLDFWRTLARRSLTGVNRYGVAKEEAAPLPDGTEAVTFLGERSSDGYWLCLALPRNSFCFIPGEREVCMIEFWGPRKAFDKHLEAVKAAVRTFGF